MNCGESHKAAQERVSHSGLTDRFITGATVTASCSHEVDQYALWTGREVGRHHDYLSHLLTLIISQFIRSSPLQRTLSKKTQYSTESSIAISGGVYEELRFIGFHSDILTTWFVLESTARLRVHMHTAQYYLTFIFQLSPAESFRFPAASKWPTRR